LIFKNQKLKAAAVLFTAVVLIIILYTLNPTEYKYYPPCYFKEITGYLCPGCGGIRATHLLLRGQIIEAIKSNLLIVLFIPIISYYLISEIIFLLFNKKLPPFNPPLFVVIIFIVVIICYWIFRNINI